MRVGGRIFAVVVLAGGLVLGPTAVLPAGAIVDVVVGTCVFEELDVRFVGSALNIASSTPTVDFSGDGWCVTNGLLVDASLDAEVAPHFGTMNCLAGEGHGDGTFYVDGFADIFDIDVTLVNLAGTWTVVIVNETVPPMLVGVGTFVQWPTATVACLDGGLQSTSWTGAVVFEDPTLP